MSEYDALRKVIEHEANQDDDGGFFARLGGLEPDPEDDGPTAKGLFQHWDAERDGPAFKWPARGGVPPGYFNRNSYTYQYDPKITPKKSAIDHLIKSFMAIEAKRKRQPIVKVRRKWVWIIFRTWAWECQICYISDHQSTWRKAYAQADRHARNHHRSTR